jgi:hypothetical protein
MNVTSSARERPLLDDHSRLETLKDESSQADYRLRQ